ncbi:MAG: hypothetical protein DSZ27_07195 [Thiomicrospira sp.]|nr:MAG: hypothetical protein DSZ27_07195 [Thiomicrospira sp.]
MTKITHLKVASGYRELSINDLKKYLRRVATDQIKVAYTGHAKQRMAERNITTSDINNVIQTGSPEHAPVFSSSHGTWECNIFGRSAGKQIRIGLALQLMEPDEKTYVLILTAIDLD